LFILKIGFSSDFFKKIGCIYIKIQKDMEKKPQKRQVSLMTQNLTFAGAKR